MLPTVFYIHLWVCVSARTCVYVCVRVSGWIIGFIIFVSRVTVQKRHARDTLSDNLGNERELVYLQLRERYRHVPDRTRKTQLLRQMWRVVFANLSCRALVFYSNTLTLVPSILSVSFLVSSSFFTTLSLHSYNSRCTSLWHIYIYFIL